MVLEMPRGPSIEHKLRVGEGAERLAHVFLCLVRLLSGVM